MEQKVETITTKQILALLEKQQYRCAVTGWMLTPETASIDHRIPYSKGGSHSIDNAQIVDWRVNQAKGTMSNEEFVEMCRAVAASASCATSA
jgi:5-methylcytosine-specific restriction endonuclease McrA